MITLAYVSPYLAKPLRNKFAVAHQYIRWSYQALQAAELARESGNIQAEAEYTTRAAECSIRAGILTEQIDEMRLREFEKIMEVVR